MNHEPPEMSPRLRDAFDSLHADSAAEPDAGAMQAARAAMHRAVAERPERAGLALFAERIRMSLTPRRLTAAGGALAGGLAVVAVLGWNAPAGSPLHAVRVAHESLVLSLPGADRVALDLDFAEARMRDAQQQAGSWAPSLDEAARLLDDAHRNLQAGSPLWPRWENDESTLQDLRHRDVEGSGTPSPGGGDEGTGGGTESGGTSSSAGGGGDDHGGTTSSSSTTTERESQSSSSTTEHESQSSTSSSSQTTSGGSDGGGSSSSTSTSTDGGGTGSGGSGGDG